jgi:hypothetical protein
MFSEWLYAEVLIADGASAPLDPDSSSSSSARRHPGMSEAFCHRLRFGEDRLATAGRVVAPMRDQPPAQEVERALAGVVIFPNDQQPRPSFS